MPMYTAASPGNLFPKFSGPAAKGTIAHRASVLQNATAVVAAGSAAAGAHCVVGAAPTAATVSPAPRASTAIAALKRILPLIEHLLVRKCGQGSARRIKAR